MNVIISPELAAVNSMLTSSGLPKVDNVEGMETANTSGWKALNVLSETLQDVLSEGINDNIDIVDLTPDAISGFIYVPKDALSCRSIDREWSSTIIVRDGRLFYRRRSGDEDGFVFTQPIRCEIRWMQRFEDLQSYVRSYITWRAARDFQRRFVNNPETDQWLALKENESLQNFKAMENSAMQANIMGQPFMQEPYSGYGDNVFGWKGDTRWR